MEPRLSALRPGGVFAPVRRSGSPVPTDLERAESRGPRIKELRNLFVTRDRTPLETTNNFCSSKSGIPSK